MATHKSGSNSAKFRRTRRVTLAASLGLALIAGISPLSAATLDWDITPGTVGVGDNAITGGTGTWNTILGNWTTDAGANNVAWNNANLDIARFGGIAGTVTISAPITVGGLEFDTNGYIFNSTLATDTLTLGATPITIDVATGTTTVINSIIAGGVAGNTLNLVGGGQLTLGNAANTFAHNIVVDGAGTTLAGVGQGNNATNRFGATAKSITLQNGGTFRALAGAGMDFSTGSKTIVIGAGGGTISVDSATTMDLNDGSQFSGTGNLTKTGAGTLRIQNQGFTYTGANVNINEGTLDVNNAGSLGAGTTAINLATGATFSMAAGVTLSGTKSLNINGTGTTVNVTAGTGTFTGSMTISADPTITGNGNLVVNGLTNNALGARTITRTGTGALQTGVLSGFNGTTTFTGTGGFVLGNAIDVNVTTTSANGEITQNGAATPGSTYTVPVTGILGGDIAFLTSLTPGGNLTNAFPTTIAQTENGANNMLGFANDRTRTFGIAATSTDTATIGIGTPWSGISNDLLPRTWTTGTITASSPILMRGQAAGSNLILGNGTTATTLSLASSDISVRRDAFIVANGVTLNAGSTAGPTADYSGLSRFVITNGATLQSNQGHAFGGVSGSAKPIVEILTGGTLDPGSGGSSGQGSINTNVYVRNRGRLLVNDANNMNGTGTIRVDAGGIIQLATNAGSLGSQNLNTASNGAVYRMELNNITSLNTNINPAGVFVVLSADRTQSAGLTLNTGSVPGGFASGMLTNDGSSRAFNSSGSSFLRIGAAGGNISAAIGTTFTVGQAISPLAGSGVTALTFGSYMAPDPSNTSLIRAGAVALNAANNASLGGSGDADRIGQFNILAGATLRNSTAGSIDTQLGLTAFRDVSLGGTLQLFATTTAANPVIGDLVAHGGGILHLDSDATTPANIQVTLGGGSDTGTITRTGNSFAPNHRGTIGFQSDTPARMIGGSTELVKFANAVDAPAKISVVDTSGNSQGLDMVAPWIYALGGVGANTNTISFLKHDAADVTTVGLKPVTYGIMPTGGTGTEIVDVTAATALPSGTTTIAALRQSAGVTGNTLRITSGGIIGAGAAAGFTTTSAIEFVTGNGDAANPSHAVEGLIINNANQVMTFSGPITALNGLTKSGPNSVVLNNPANNFGNAGIIINQTNLRAGALDGFGRINNVSTKVIVNHNGVLDLNNVATRIRGLLGEGQVTNTNGTSTNTVLTIDTIDGDNFEFNGVTRNGSSVVALTKTGLGTQALNGNIAHAGATSVNGGTLLVNGISTATSNYTVNSGGTLGGSGLILGTLNVVTGGTLSPGNSPGMLSVNNNVTLASGSFFKVELNGTSFDLYNQPNLPVVQYDRLNVTGSVALGGSTLVPSLSFTPNVGDKFFIIDNDQIDAVTGTFAGLSEGSTFNVGATEFTIYYGADTYSGALSAGNDVALVVTAIPEPSTLVLGALGLLGVAGLRLRRRRLA